MHHLVIQVILWSVGRLNYRQHHGGGILHPRHCPCTSQFVYIRVVHSAPWSYLLTTCQLHTTWAITKQYPAVLKIIFISFLTQICYGHYDPPCPSRGAWGRSCLGRQSADKHGAISELTSEGWSRKIYQITRLHSIFASYFACSIMLTIFRSEYSTASLSESIRA